ncbi:Scr1 family TA system antitoxin-like transcriptional regulator [Streptomyces bluensis]|uniref:Scr1 family TA system antitoxin-like transcriptional regulator n=1 Tax=Streptomyces bluensis TaxID=33897 RepID=UPI00332058D5
MPRSGTATSREGQNPRASARGASQLLEAAERPTVTLKVIPFTSEDFVEATQPVFYAGGVVPQLDTVQVDSAVGGVFLGMGTQLKKYGTLLDLAERVALSAEHSRRFIHDITREL